MPRHHRDRATRNSITCTRTKRLFLRIAALLFCCAGIFAQENDASPAAEQPEPETPSVLSLLQGRKLPVDVRVKRVILRYETDVSFLFPEGEFNATFEKSIGSYTSITSAHYNYLRGEMGFTFRNIFTRFHLVPELTLFDQLKFVPLFNKDNIWRREQGVRFGGRFLFPLPANSMTSVNYTRYSYPSAENASELDAQKVFSVSQSFAGEIDSLQLFGFLHSGLFEMEVARAFAVAGSNLNFWQYRLLSTGKSVRPRFSVQGKFEWITLLGGDNAPARFLGGRNRLSAFDVNQFSGVNLLYADVLSRITLTTLQRHIAGEIDLYSINWLVHAEVGQAGDDKAMRNYRRYHASAGIGISTVTMFKKQRAFELNFMVYKGLEPFTRIRYYFGITL